MGGGLIFMEKIGGFIIHLVKGKKSSIQECNDNMFALPIGIIICMILVYLFAMTI